MKRTLFTDGWQFREKVNPFAEIGGQSAPYQDVTLPHDAQIGRQRDPQGEGATAYFPSGAYQYRKTFELPPEAGDDAHVEIAFEGVMRDAVVTINGGFAGQRPFGYSSFTVDATPFLQPGANEIVVECRTHRDSRWYTGAGIYRDVWLLAGGMVHVAADGLRISTPDVEHDAAVVEVATTLRNSGARARTVDVDAVLTDPSGHEVARGTAPVTVPAGASAVSRQRLRVADPALWNAETPVLYEATLVVSAAGKDETLDRASSPFGIRRLQLDAVNGLRVNGETVKLRGACVHHDNGILGAATFPAAEERRVRILKDAGFNAIRSSHNPASPALLDACDRLGMYVLDETFDVWTSGKSEFDYALHFADWWERDVESMVAKDFNHPSVVMYSIGNEIPETGSTAGGVVGRQLAEKVRSLDPTRFVTNAVNGMLAVLDEVKVMASSAGAESAGPESAGSAGDDTAGINTLMAGPGEFMNAIGASELVTGRTAESFALLDVAGMNYLDSRYVMDRELFPNRVILGTETFPTRIDDNWALVQQNGHVIGDFTWTGWDYLGEAGLGRAQCLSDAEPTPSLSAPYPWIAAWCGDVDLVGFRRPASYYREIVFGRRSEPYIAVVRPRPEGETLYAGPWTWSDSIGSWTWPGAEGRTLTVEVYSDADEVELLLDGQSVGRAPAGPEHRFRAEFAVPYAAGELTAVALRSGAPAERFTLLTAAEPAGLRLSVDRSSALAFVEIELTDADGTLFTAADRPVTVSLTGPAVLQALGSANPAPDQSYATDTHPTFDGRALAAVRSTGPGEIVVRVAAEGCGAAELVLDQEGDIR
ncbi:glycoside hydrolase family 2 TIM barrel-domain containing protein [Herbiconiux ginsengi]|uniref:Glycosyl hydrolases family 2, sugar binding domain n=1 Tax=Herbiconiux ginsengi TaxID=381665 RepID=A0A1H3L7R6_9MICO|nr:glycoside hydrolase family 2 TIM barrel-domain containing protein [Herbiconiux ginsengi]SDY60360.1 Glycosyl hydrolases family 2, sugar binding domain [Herbiconiux ginsengi]